MLKRRGDAWRCHRDGNAPDDGSDADADADADGNTDGDDGNDDEPSDPWKWPDGSGATPSIEGGCASGSSTGVAETDRARCVVVGLELPSNGLRGPLPDGLCDLNLQILDVRDNDISGRMPRCFARLGAPSFDHNGFDYVESDPTLRELIERCRTSGDAYCSGVPPLSCGAFGDNYQVRSDDSQRCVECPSLGQSIALQLVALLLFAALVVGYVRVVASYQRLGEKLDLWINTAAIFFCHLQTVSIVGTLKLAWPASVELLTEIASVDFLSLGAVRPECTLRIGENSFYFFTLLRITLLLVLVLGISCVQKAVKMCSAAKDLQKTVGRVDQLEMVETVLFTFGLTLSWRVIFDLWEQGRSSIAVARAGTGLATVLFVVQLQILTKYALNIRALVTGKHLDLELPPGVGARVGLPRGAKVAVANLSHERLQRRLSFLTERFGSHAPYWQFVVWLRQFLLTLDVWVAGLVVDGRDNIKEGQTYCNVAYRNATTGAPLPMNNNEYALLDDGSSNTSMLPPDAAAINATADPYCRPLSAASLSAIWTHVAFAVLIFVCFWAAQLRVKPYAYAFQNAIESWLFVANIALVVLGTAYTSLKVSGDLSPGIEVLCVLLLIGSLLAAAGFMVNQSRREHLKRRRDLAGRVDLSAGVQSASGGANGSGKRPPSGKGTPFQRGVRARTGSHDLDVAYGEDGGGDGAKDRDAPTRGAALRAHRKKSLVQQAADMATNTLTKVRRTSPFGTSKAEPPPLDVSGAAAALSDPLPPPLPGGGGRRGSRDERDRSAQKLSLLAELEILKAENSALKTCSDATSSSDRSGGLSGGLGGGCFPLSSGEKSSGSALSGSAASLELSALPRASPRPPALPPTEGQAPPPLPWTASTTTPPPPLPSPSFSSAWKCASVTPPPLPGRNGATPPPLPGTTPSPLPGRSARQGAPPATTTGRLLSLSMGRGRPSERGVATTNPGVGSHNVNPRLTPSPPGSARDILRAPADPRSIPI